MLEILFRGRYGTKWVYGYYEKYCDSYLITKGGFSYGVIPETIGQYTGRKDVKGNCVYQLDKIQAGSFVYIVTWSENECAWFCNPIQQKHRITTSKPLFEVLDEWMGVVVGNVFDNPELLELKGVE